MSSTYKDIEKRVIESKKSKKINLDKLSLTTLPGSAILGKLSSKYVDGIEEFTFTNNLAHTIDEHTILTSLPGLKRLDLSHNNLTTVHDLALGADSAPAALSTIDLSHNKLSEFPQFVLSAGLSLTSLTLTHNALGAVAPGLLDRLTTLTSLDLSFNALCALPSGLPATLQTLSLRGNRITRVAEGTLGALTSLTALDLSDNRLARLPADLRGLDALETLALGGNPWESPRAAVCEAGRAAVFAELERLAGARASAATSRVADLACAAAGGAVTFALVACDPQGVPRITGGDDVRAEMRGPAAAATVEARVEDTQSGVYAVSLDVAVPGTYRLDVLVNGEPLAASPYTVHVWPAAPSEDEDSAATTTAAAESSSEKDNSGNDDENDENEDDDDDGKNGKLLAGAVAACREYNIPVEVPEILICGAAGYEEVVEAVAGVFPVRVPRGCLRRPLVLNFVYSEKAAADPAGKPEITLMKDQLLGSAVSMGLRDIAIDDPAALAAHIARRNSVPAATAAAAAAAAPVTVQFAGRYSLPHRIVVAPALPTAAEAAASGEAEVQQAAAAAFLDERLRACAAAVCVLPAMEWRLAQTSGWLPRLRAADPLLARTHFLFTGLAPFLASFHSPVALADFVRGKPAFGPSCCFATLPASAADLADAAHYTAALRALAARDAAALERLWGDRALRAAIGVRGLRRTLAAALRAHYREVLPRLQQHIADTRARKLAEAARMDAARAALDAPALPADLRAAATQRAVAFAAAVAATLRGAPAAGSVAAHLAAEAGTTLAEEVEAVLDTGFPLRGLVLAETGAVPRAEARVYGGAQIDRLVAFFRASAQKAADAPPPFPDAMAHCSACANKAAAAVAPACQAARAEARAALVPLVNFLADAATLAVKRCADVADQMLDRKRMAAGNAAASMTMMGLEEFSYLSTNVNGIFVELASTAIEQLRDACLEAVERVQPGQIPQEDFGAPYVEAEKGADAAAAQGKAEWLAQKMYTRMVTEEAAVVAARFYGELLEILSVRVPAETHATIMGFADDRIAGMFKIGNAKEAMDAKIAALKEEIEKCSQKQKEISEIAIN